jgi:CBS domain containing-hemolysin-like protein
LIRYFHIEPSQADWIAFAVGFTIITFLHIVVGEIAPKSLAIQKPLPTSLWIARPLHWFYKSFYPVIWALNHAAFWLLRRCGIQPASESELVHSEEEIRLILGRSRRYAKSRTQDIALNAFALRQRRACEVMTPRHEIVVLNTKNTIKECVAVARRARYSRFPLCVRGDLDRAVGVIHAKDLLNLQRKTRRGRGLAAVAHKMIFMPEKARLEEVLSLFLQCKLHLALVVNEFGNTVGLVTLENVVEELVGPIEDEFHHDEPCIRQTGKRTWDIKGSSRVRLLGEFIGQPLEETAGASTVSGLVIRKLGRFARPGDVLELNGSELRVEEVSGTRTTRIKLTCPCSKVGASSREAPESYFSTDFQQTGSGKADVERSKILQAA